MALRYLTTAEAAEAIGVSPNTMRAYMKAGPIPRTNIGSEDRPRWRIAEDDLRAFMSKRAKAAGAA